MIILDTAIYCHDCGKQLHYDLTVLVDITLDGKRQGFDHVCILCNDCSEEEDA